MAIRIKRVVTAIGADGESTIQEAEEFPAITPGLLPGTEVFTLWGTEGTAAAPVREPAESVWPTYFPAVNGTRFGVITIPPEERDAPPPEPPSPEVLQELSDEMESKLPGLLGVFDPHAPGFHTTTSVDYCVVLQGTLTLVLGDGGETELPPGSCVIQNGTRHAWFNYGVEPAILAFTLVGAEGV